MTNNTIAQALRNHKLKDAILSRGDRDFLHNVQNTMDTQGQITARAAKPFRTPLTFDWHSSVAQRLRSPRAGTAVMIGVHAVTPPSSGQLIVRISQETDTSGETVLTTVYVPSGTKMFEQSVTLDILAGSWLSMLVESFNGASSVSVSMTVNVG